MKIKYLIIFLIALCAIHSFAVTLVDNKKSNSFIIIPAEPQPSVEVAANELVYHINKSTGVKLNIYKENAIPKNATGHKIYLGKCKNSIIDPSTLPPAGFLIKATSNTLHIIGNDRNTGPVGSSWHAVWHGTLWGVYEFLETQIGVYWIWPGELGEVIPQKYTIKIAPYEFKDAPKLRFTDLTARRSKYNRVNWSNPKNEEKYWEAECRFLLRHRIGSVVNMNYSHEFGLWWKLFGKKHPEYFALNTSGTRGPLPETPSWGTHLMDMCVSNKAFHQQILTSWAKRPKKLKQLRPYINLGLNDCPILCVCKDCRAWDQKDHRFAKSPYWGKGKKITFKERWSVAKAAWGEEGTTQDDIPSLSNRHARYLLAVQELAKKQYPNVPIVSFAYANYRKPPTEVKLNNGIIILNTAALFFPYTAKASNEFRKEWIGWKNTGVLQHYRPNLLHAGANLPVFYAKRFADDFNFAYKNGMISSQMDSLFGTWANQGPNIYTVLRMHSNPERNANDILKNFYNCFGPAAKEIEKYFSIFEKRSEEVTEEMWLVWQKRNRTKSGLGGTFKNFVAIAPEYMTNNVIKQAKAQLTKAKQAAKNDSLTLKRIEFLEKGLTEAILATNCRKAQIVMEKEKTKAAKAEFRQAWVKLNNYRNLTEKDMILDVGKARFREQTGCNWPKK